MDANNTTYNNSLPAGDSGAIEMQEPENMRNVAMGIVAFLSVCGTTGNALVLYVFSRQKDKLSSTIFILTLAGTDFITSLVTMPYTIAIELLRYKIEFDVVCKIYYFLATSTIPFSAFVMVAIAVDRYLCIVHPFKHYMTIQRAKIVVLVLVVFASTLGLLCCLMYGVYHKVDIGPEAYANSVYNTAKISENMNMSHPSTWNITTPQTKTIIVHTGKCHKDGLIFDQNFFNIYRKIYSSFFGICAVIVIVLYAIIYRSVLMRRRHRLTLATFCCGFWRQMPTSEQDGEQTEFTVMNQSNEDKSATASKDDTPAETTQNSQLQENGSRRSHTGNGSSGDKDALARPSGISRAKFEKLRMAYIKTALMLSIVALTYIVAFMPAWLMAYQVIPMNVIVFYLYFTYHVANPIIYAFLNQSFRNRLQALFKWGTFGS